MDYRKEYEKWLASPALSEDERTELKALEGNDKEIKARFYGPLEFGTAGLRGTMYTGLHNMNRHVIRWATQGFANVIRAEGEEAMKKGVAICMDCRNHSMEFARAAACVMAGNGITVKLFESLRPTPELSFAVREYGCEAGINVTASHNPKEYNGYKVYWSDGAQLPPQHAAAIAKELEHIDIFTGVTSMDFDEAVNKGLITMLGEDCDKRFMANVMSMVNDYETVKKVADDFKLVYTPYHGCGHKLVPEALTRLGIKHLLCVPEQMVIDGNFPPVVSPNPENPEGFYLAIDLAKKNDVDFILGTDPDSDRGGIMVRNKQGEFEPVTGNQTGVLLLDYLIGAMKRAGKLPAKAAALKTIVTTEMARAVAEANGLDCYDTFTGFKFMAEKMNELEGAGKNTVIFSYEESYGYMIGHYVRDKDAVTASLLLTEMAAWYYSQGMTLFDALNALFEKFGVSEENISIVADILCEQEGIYQKREGDADLYVGIPFCPSKCTYCSFITADIRATEKFLPDYLRALEREIAACREFPLRYKSAYVGGGTPLVLSVKELEPILKAVRALVPSDVEFTVEAGRPDVFGEEKLSLLKDYGVTRICVNPQSFNDRTLAAIGRRHTAADIYRAYEMSTKFGFLVNFDLIAGLTGETLAEFSYSIDEAVRLSPENITVHTLCLKKGAKLKESESRLEVEDIGNMIAYSREKLYGAGYLPYYLYRQKYMAGNCENTGWCRKGTECVYNVDIMEEITDNVACGANAVSKKVIFGEGRIERYGAPKDLKTYIGKTDAILEEKRKLYL